MTRSPADASRAAGETGSTRSSSAPAAQLPMATTIAVPSMLGRDVIGHGIGTTDGRVVVGAVLADAAAARDGRDAAVTSLAAPAASPRGAFPRSSATVTTTAIAATTTTAASAAPSLLLPRYGGGAAGAAIRADGSTGSG